MNRGAVNGNADGIGHPEEDSNCACPDCRSPADGPPAWLRDKAVSIWCGDYFIQLADELGEDPAEEGILAFASGLEKGIVMAMIKPEWVQGLYLRLREYYLTTHSLSDLLDREEHAEATARAIAIYSLIREKADDHQT